MEAKDFYSLCRNYWGKKATMIRTGGEYKIIKITLYDSFSLHCKLTGDNDTFEGGLITHGDNILTNYLGKELSANNNPESILENFKIIDEYCRLLLPDKFLKVYDKLLEK